MAFISLKKVPKNNINGTNERNEKYALDSQLI